jgi:hypothetical protein
MGAQREVNQVHPEPVNIPQKSSDYMVNDDDVQLCMAKNINQRNEENKKIPEKKRANSQAKKPQTERRRKNHENENIKAASCLPCFALDCVICEPRNLWHSGAGRVVASRRKRKKRLRSKVNVLTRLEMKVLTDMIDVEGGAVSEGCSR